MANNIATVSSLEGQAWAKAANGTLRPLKVGDRVAVDEVVVTASGAHIELDFGDGHPVAIAGGQEVTLGRDLWTDIATDNKEAAVQDASVQEALTVLNNGGDLTENLEAAAAGLTGGGANESHSFVQLTRVLEQTSPEAFNFNINNNAGTDNTPFTAAAANTVNHAPDIADQSFNGDEDTPITGTIAATDIENDVLTYSISGQPANGVITIDAATGGFSYTPKANYNGPDSFVVTVTDDHGNVTTKIINLTVNPVNDAPVSSDQNLTTPEDTPISGQVVATDVEGDTLAYSITGTATHGTVTLDPATGAFVYTPNADYNGSDKFVVTISDGNGGFTTSTINIGVTPVNDAPVSGDQNLTTPEDTPITGKVVATDVDGDTLAYSVSSAATHGTVTLDPATGGFVYTPSANYNGSDKFVVTISDGHGGTTTSTINIGVTPVNDAPITSDQNLTTPEDTPISGTVTATDPDGDTLVYSVSSTTTHGTVTLNPATGAFVYTPNANYNGSDKFVVTVSDGQGGTTTSTINIGVTPVNDPPVTSDQNLTTDEDIPINGQVVATDIDGDTLSYTVSGTATHGAVTIDPVTGAFVYTPDTGYSGSDSFIVTVADGHGGVATSNISIGVTPVVPVNAAPIAVNDTTSTTQDTAVTVAVRSNDTDPDADPLTVSGVTQGANGSVVIDAVTGNPIYTPNVGYTGSDSFTYTINDGHGHTSTATVSVTVNAVGPINLAPTAVDDATTTTQDTAVTVAVRSNDTDPDGDPLTVSGVTQGVNGSVVIDAVTGNPIYTPNVGYVGGDSFTYTINDGHGHTSTATVLVTVNAVAPVNAAPTAVNDSVATDEDTSVTVAVRSNDTDPDSDPLTVSGVTQGAHGSVVIDAVTGNPIYTPNANFNGTDSFTYTINDGNGHTSTATVNVTVNPVNDAPVNTVPATQTLPQDGSVVFNSGNGNAISIGDVDAGAATVEVTLTVTHGLIDLSGTTGLSFVIGSGSGDITMTFSGSIADINNALNGLIYTPNAGYNGSAALQITTNDLGNTGSGGAKTDTDSIALTVQSPLNHAPAAVNDTASTEEGVAVTVAVRTNDTDADGDALTVTGVTQGTNGSVVIDAVTGNPIYTPNGGFAGSDSFTYTVDDGHGGTATATVNVSVLPNLPPVANNDTAVTSEDTPATIAVRTNDTDPNSGDTLTVTGITQGTNGSVVIDAVTGNPIYTPNANFNGIDSFTYTIDDGHGGTSTATVHINVVAVDDPSVLAADTQTINEDTTATGNVLLNDFDVDSVLQVAGFSINGTNYTAGDTATIAGVGTLQLLATGDYIFVPDANYNGTVPTVTYTTNTGSSSTLDITVNPVNDAPIAIDDNFTTNEDTAITLTVRSNDTDPDGDPLTVSSVTQGANGSVVIDPITGNPTYTPNANFNGTDSFTYTVSDGHGGTSTATVNINVVAVDDASVLAADTQTINEDTTATGNVLLNDFDIDSVLQVAGFSINGTNYTAGDTATIAGVGTLQLLATGDYIFVPNANYNGTVPTVTYTTNTGSSSTLDITVNPVNDAPIAVDDNFTTNEDVPIVISLNTLAVNDTDVDGDTLTVVGVSNIQHGSLNLVGSDLIFTPDANYSGPASFQYTIFDGHGGSDTATVNITVIPVDDPSVLVADTQTINEDTTATGNVLSNDSDVDSVLTLASFNVNGVDYTAGSTATIAGVGSLQMLATGDYTFVPLANYNGTVPTVTYTTNTGSNTTLNITVNPVNDAPVAHDDNFSTHQNQALTIHFGDLTANDTDIDGDTLTVVGVSNIQHGSLSLVGSDLIFTPDAGYSGPASFQYSIFDGHGGTDTATANITVLPPAGSLSLSATPTLTEAGGDIIYTATLTNAQSSSVTVHLANGETITINAGQLTGTATVPFAANEDVYIDPSNVTNSISSATGGDFGLVVDHSTVTTSITDTIDTTNITLTAAANAVEGGSIIYTATVGSAVTGSPLVIHLSNGTDITIPVNGISANSAPVAVRGDDAYIQGNQTVTVGISGTTGGNYEALNTSSTVSTVVSDDGSTTSVTLTAAANVNEGGSIVYTATVGNTVTGTPLVVHLSNGTDITIPVGATSANSAAIAVRGDDAYIQGNQTVTVGISGTTGGNYEALNTSSTVSTVVSDNGSTTSVTLTAAANVNEGGSIVYTATVGNIVTGTPLVVHLSNGTDITIPVGATSANSAAVAVRADDVYAQGNQTVTVGISGTTGGNYETLNTSSTVNTTVSDDADVTTLSLTGAASITEGAAAGAYTLALTNLALTDVTVTLNYTGTAINGTDFNGATSVTILAGTNSASFNIAALTDMLNEGTENFTVSVNGTTGGGFESLVVNPGANSVTTSIIDVPFNHAPVAVNDPSGAAYSVSLGDASASDLWTNLDSKGLTVSVNPYTITGAAGTLYQATVDGNANVIGVGGSSPRTVPGTQVFQQIEYDQTTGKSETLELVFNGNLNQASFAVSRLFPGENGGEVGEWSAYYKGALVAQNSFRLPGSIDHGSFTINTGSLVFDSVKFTALNTIDSTGDGGDYFLTSFSGSGPASANTNYTIAEGGTLNIPAASSLRLLSNDTDADADSLSISQINGSAITDGQSIALASGASLLIHTDGSFSYAAGNAFNYLSSGTVTTDSFNYTVSDGHGGTSTATATVTIVGKDLTGTSGNDVLVGGSYSEQIIGGRGNDTMTGGLGADTFKWLLNDQGAKGSPAVDRITDFNMAQGDSLNLRDLLQNESSGNMTHYLHFTYDGTNTTVAISNTGSFDGSAAAYTSKVDQTIVLNGVNLTTIGTGSDTDIITQLKNNGNLITD